MEDWYLNFIYQQNNIIHGDLLNITAEHIKSMKLTSYQYWLGNENPSISNEIAKIFKGKIASSGKNSKLTFHGIPYVIHYSIARLRSENAENSTANKSEVVLFIEIINDERIIFETLSRYMIPSKVQQVVTPEGRGNLVGSKQKFSYFSATITNCII